MKNFTIKTLNGMAYGLFATLIVGVILKQIGIIFDLSIFNHRFFDSLSNILTVELYNLLSSLMGVGIALGIGIVLKKEGLQLVMIAIIGAISTSFVTTFGPFNFTASQGLFDLGKPGNPLTAYFVTIFTVLLMDLIYRKKTPVDIIIIPMGAIIISLLFTLLLSFPLDFLTENISKGIKGIEAANTAAPIVMVIVISVSMGMLLTSPISSAAISFAISLSGFAAGAAVVGTSIQMIGFAIQSRRDNKIGEVISIGIGTSMLQFKNIVKKPIIWLPTILASAIIAPFTYLLGFQSNKFGAGMGTSGLVGPLQSLDSMEYSLMAYVNIAIIILCGGLLVYLFDKILYRKGFIKDGDLSLKEEL